MDISQRGIDLIKEFEGCKLTAYQDQVGVWTVGFGSTHGVTKGMTITQLAADDMLAYDLDVICHKVSEMLIDDCNQNQFDALCSFAYNLGCAALRRSTLLALMNQGRTMDAADQFPKWCMAGGKSNPGLLRRRKAEQSLFLK